MKKSILIAAVVLLGSLAAMSQPAADLKHIDNLCGCFEVQFKYAETFAPDEEYPYRNREIMGNVLELVLPVEKSGKRIILQHLLVVRDTIVIKHWREDWLYESPVLMKYKGDMVWEKEQLPAKQVKKKWTQTVWEVSDAPRYQGQSEWVSTDNKVFWMNTTDAPLPRREYTKRKDYNVLNRRNTIIVDANKWVHEQDNQKIARSSRGDSLIAEEKGLNIYTRVEDSRCNEAKVYWEKNKDYWTQVRNLWDDYLGQHNTVSVKRSVDNKPMYQFLGEIEEELSAGKIAMDEAVAKAKATLQQFVSGQTSARN